MKFALIAIAAAITTPNESYDAKAKSLKVVMDTVAQQ